MILLRHRSLEVCGKSRAEIGGRYKLVKGINGGYMDVDSGLWIPGREIVTGTVDWFQNIITNYGLNGVNATVASSFLTYAHVGTGTTAAAATDTQLETHVSASELTALSNSNSVESTPPYFCTYTVGRRFSEGDAEGTISEVGMSGGATNTNMFSRALVADGGGSPTTIAVSATEWLDVYYALDLFPDHVLSGGGADDGTGTIDISGVSTDYTIRPASITSGSFWIANAILGTAKAGANNSYAYGSDAVLGAVTATPSGSGAGAITASISASSYSTDTFTRDTAWEFSLGQANASGGVGALEIVTGMGKYQILFDPVVAKDSSKVWTYNHRIAWSRHAY